MPAVKCYFDAHLQHLSLDTSTTLPFPHTVSHPSLNTALRSKAYGPKTGSLSLSVLLLLQPLNSASRLLHLSRGAGYLHGVVFKSLTPPYGPPVVLGFHFAPNLSNVCAEFLLCFPCWSWPPWPCGDPSSPSRQ